MSRLGSTFRWSGDDASEVGGAHRTQIDGPDSHRLEQCFSLQRRVPVRPDGGDHDQPALGTSTHVVDELEEGLRLVVCIYAEEFLHLVKRQYQRRRWYVGVDVRATLLGGANALHEQ